MRPEKLFILFSDATTLKGVGPGVKKALARLFHGDESAHLLVRDVLFHLPAGVVDRRNSPSLNAAKDGDVITLIATVETHQPPTKTRGSKLPYKVICHTTEGYLTLVFFHARAEYLSSALPVGQKRVISGRLERYGYVPQIVHPDVIAPAHDLARVQTLESCYALTAGLNGRQLRRILESALAVAPQLPEWIEAAYLKQQAWSNWKTTLVAAHHPQKPEEIEQTSPNRLRLAYDELLANQLALALIRKRLRKSAMEPLTGNNQFRSQLLAALPFALTQGQKNVISEIDVDLTSGQRMVRLLQGDVGSGKTVVALLAMLRVVEAGKQAALMVPTEILGKQHFAFIKRYADRIGVQVCLLIGNMKAKEYQDVTARIAGGEVDIVIGTHALLQDKIEFKALALAVIDEQHRFGVAQRMALTAKSNSTHMLVMTATPIPRTLALTAFGDMDVSMLTEKPANRASIITRAITLARAQEVLEGIARAIAKGEKAYWICPLVEENEEENVPTDLAAAEARYTEFLHRFGERVGMVHGRMQASERDKVMAGFAGNEYDIMVATTVVEVGVDVPQATIIVIEHAERFGLAQLHQLRGRVGRSEKDSSCILLYDERCSATAKSRLRVLRETTDGFRIAEEDLKLRGSGDILGTKQSGLPEFWFANLTIHYDLLRSAREEAKCILHNDPNLLSQRGEALRHLLYLFGHDENIRFLDAG